MNVLIYDNEEQIGIAAGNYMCGQVLQKPDSRSKSKTKGLISDITRTLLLF